MTLDDLNASVASATGWNKAEAAKTVHAVLKAIQNGLTSKDNGKVSIAGFGIFEVVERGERLGRNPQTGQEIKIAASKAVKFKPGKGLKDAIHG